MKSTLPTHSVNNFVPIKEATDEILCSKNVGNIRERELFKNVLDVYGQHRGMSSKQYATTCLQVANTFKVAYLININQ